MWISSTGGSRLDSLIFMPTRVSSRWIAHHTYQILLITNHFTIEQTSIQIEAETEYTMNIALSQNRNTNSVC